MRSMRRGHVAIVTGPLGCHGSACDDWGPGDLSGEGRGRWGERGARQREIQWSIMGFQRGILGGRSPGIPDWSCWGKERSVVSPEGVRLQGWNMMVPISVDFSIYTRLPENQRKITHQINYIHNQLNQSKFLYFGFKKIEIIILTHACSPINNTKHFCQEMTHWLKFSYLICKTNRKILLRMESWTFHCQNHNTKWFFLNNR